MFFVATVQTPVTHAGLVVAGAAVRARGPGAGAGTIYVGNGAALGRRRMEPEPIKPINVESGIDAMIQFLRKIQQGSEYQNVIKYLQNPKQGKKVPETMEKLRNILTNEFSGLDLSRKVIDDMLVEAAASIMGTPIMDDVMKRSPSLATIAAEDLRDDIKDSGVGKTILENLKVVLQAVRMLQEDPSSIGRKPSAAQPVSLSSTSGYRDTGQKPRDSGVFQAPGATQREPTKAGRYSAADIDDEDSSSSSGEDYRLTLLRLRM